MLSVLVEAQRDERLARVDAGPCPLRGMQPASVVASGEDALAHGAAVSLLAASVKIRDHAVDHDGVVGRVPGTSVRVARRLDAAGRGRAAAACLLGPCERRRECLDEVLAACWTQ